MSSVTAAVCASARPWTSAPVFSVMDARAMMVPTKSEFVPRVAELPTFQNTLQACAPLMSLTLLFEAVISVSVVWKMKTALGSPSALSVSSPVIPNVGFE
ncbi:hypothetical protein H4687_004441 [Streptomyces stelliscabiei]|uniref:Uncharacterized protein n=1 Tax=Streptomyces stelliscabiei TaxID=146820 RepID=A0A8I0TS85_9ACTN|nr:hypothetical protein [Streptomyces stelliscabiei]